MGFAFLCEVRYLAHVLEMPTLHRADGMKHAGPASLKSLTGVLDRLRRIPALTERKPGIFYLKSRACLHFHEDAAGLFADLRLVGDDFERFPVNTHQEQDALVERVTKSK